MIPSKLHPGPQADHRRPRRSVEMQEASEKKARRTLGLVFPEERRYVVRSLNGRLKDAYDLAHLSSA